VDAVLVSLFSLDRLPLRSTKKKVFFFPDFPWVCGFRVSFSNASGLVAFFVAETRVAFGRGPSFYPFLVPPEMQRAGGGLTLCLSLPRPGVAVPSFL